MAQRAALGIPWSEIREIERERYRKFRGGARGAWGRWRKARFQCSGYRGWPWQGRWGIRQESRWRRRRGFRERDQQWWRWKWGAWREHRAGEYIIEFCFYFPSSSSLNRLIYWSRVTESQPMLGLLHQSHWKHQYITQWELRIRRSTLYHFDCFFFFISHILISFYEERTKPRRSEWRISRQATQNRQNWVVPSSTLNFIELIQGATFSGMKCPEFGCADVVPKFPSESLRTQLEELVKIKLRGVDGTLYTLSVHICLVIKQETALLGLKLLWECFNWPLNIDFDSLSDCVYYHFRPELLEITQNHIALGCSPAWTVFSKMLREANISLAQFSWSRDSIKFDLVGRIKHAG